jgi:hypothetical protein
MENTSPEYLYDVRLIERHIERGLITRDAVRTHVASLPDVSHQAEQCDLGMAAHESHDASR